MQTNDLGDDFQQRVAELEDLGWVIHRNAGIGCALLLALFVVGMQTKYPWITVLAGLAVPIRVGIWRQQCARFRWDARREILATLPTALVPTLRGEPGKGLPLQTFNDSGLFDEINRPQANQQQARCLVHGKVGETQIDFSLTRTSHKSFWSRRPTSLFHGICFVASVGQPVAGPIWIWQHGVSDCEFDWVDKPMIWGGVSVPHVPMTFRPFRLRCNAFPTMRPRRGPS